MSLVYLPLNNYKNIGGPTTFIKNLAKYFESNNTNFSADNTDNAESILFPILCDTKILKQFKKEGRPIIQRLDGLYGYPWQELAETRSSTNVGRYSDIGLSLKRRIKFFYETYQINNIYKNYADLVIFQSTYCRDLSFEFIGTLPKSKYRIIHNGVHKDIFYSDPKHLIGDCISFITTGRFRRSDMLLPILDALDSLEGNLKFKLTVVGPIEGDKLLQECNKRDYVITLPPMKNNQLATELRKSDIYLFSSLNPPCPNALLEAVSCGLPVVSFNYGSINELLHFNPSLIAETLPSKNKLIKTSHHLDPLKLAEKIENAVSGYETHRSVALKNENIYSFENCGDQYLSAIKDSIENNKSKKHTYLNVQ